jgi:peptidoglycan/LPS O-acetylase OafA/YrhL
MIRSFQAFRGMAALVVLIFHILLDVAWPDYHNFLNAMPAEGLGRVAVQFFFVLSGFVICHAHWGDLSRPPLLKRFLLKRFIRLYPTYLILLLLAGGMLVAKGRFQELPPDIASYIKTLTLWPQDPAVVGGRGAPVLGVAWSLQYEVYFYFCFALAILNRWLGAAVLAFSVVGGLMFSHTVFPWRFLFADHILVFVFGIGVFALKDRLIPKNGAWACLIGGLLLALAIIPVGGQEGLFEAIVGGLAGALVLLGLLSLERQGTVLGSGRVVQLLGAASYAIYLVHFPLVNMIFRGSCVVLGKTVFSAVIASVAAVIASLLAGIAFHLWVEKPVIAALQRRLLPRRGPTAQAAAPPAAASSLTATTPGDGTVPPAASL